MAQALADDCDIGQSLKPYIDRGVKSKYCRSERIFSNKINIKVDNLRNYARLQTSYGTTLQTMPRGAKDHDYPRAHSSYEEH